METKSFAVQPDDNFEDVTNKTSAMDIHANSIRNIDVLTMNANGLINGKGFKNNECRKRLDRRFFVGA